MSTNVLMNFRVAEVLFAAAHPKLHQQFVESLDAEDQQFIKDQRARSSRKALGEALEAEQALPNVWIDCAGRERKNVQLIARP